MYISALHLHLAKNPPFPTLSSDTQIVIMQHDWYQLKKLTVPIISSAGAVCSDTQIDLMCGIPKTLSNILDSLIYVIPHENTSVRKQNQYSDLTDGLPSKDHKPFHKL